MGASAEVRLEALRRAGIEETGNVASLVWWAVSTSRWLRPPWWRIRARRHWRARQQPDHLLAAVQAVLRGELAPLDYVGQRWDGATVETP